MRRKSKGAALVEFLLMIPVLLMLWAGIYKLNSLYVIKQKMAVSCRYGAFAAKGSTLTGADLTLEIKIREQLRTCRLLDEKRLLVNSASKLIKPIYRASEETIHLTYTADTLVLNEEFNLSSEAWRFGYKRERKTDGIKEGHKWQDIFFP